MRYFVLLTLVLGANICQAKRLYGMAGCGLGHLIVGKDHQVFAAITNFSGSNQLFAVTSGTSNCPLHDLRVENRLPSYVEPNQIQLASDIARGEGETLAGLGEILGCEKSAQLGPVLQKNYLTIFEGNHQGISERILEVVRDDATLAQSCRG